MIDPLESARNAGQLVVPDINSKLAPSTSRARPRYSPCTQSRARPSPSNPSSSAAQTARNPSDSALQPSRPSPCALPPIVDKASPPFRSRVPDQKAPKQNQQRAVPPQRASPHPQPRAQSPSPRILPCPPLPPSPRLPPQFSCASHLPRPCAV